MRKLPFARSIALAIAAASLAPAPASTQTMEVIAVSGRNAPPARRFVDFSAPVVGPNGEVAFLAYGPSHGLYVYRDGKLRRVARVGKQAPGLPEGVLFDFIFQGLGFDDTGALLFSNWTTSGDAVFRTVGKRAVELVVAENVGMPVEGGEPIQHLDDWTAGSAGHVAVRDRGRIAVRAPGGVLTEVLSLDVVPPLAPPDADFDQVFALHLDGAGLLALDATVESGFAADEPMHGIWRQLPSGELANVAMQGYAPEGSAEPLAWTQLARGLADGTLFVWAQPTYEPPSPTDPGSGWIQSFLLDAPPDGPAVVSLATGTPAPGAPDGHVFHGFESIHPAGAARIFTAAVGAPLDADTSEGVFRLEPDGSIVPLALPGTEIAGEPGMTISGIGVVDVARNGDVVLGAGLAVEGVPQETSGVLAIPVGAGAPILLAKDGDPVPVSRRKMRPGHFGVSNEWLIDSVRGTGVGGGRVALHVRFDDDHSAIVTIPIPPPE